ncbi:hypothetical protein GJ744_001295 [Endocarpon pusillum]|uniref:Uncharacterized protein n=1 Tax=Endocarpon pusillum TaxID=364733 RepID=A0A8H7E3D3_9EURO|nr:hypothetical protein GJ744_001295 [Endocarpon pusillum]
MGPAMSLHLEEGLRNARLTALNEGKDRVEDILFENDEFVGKLRAAWNDLDPKRKKKFRASPDNIKSAGLRSTTKCSLSPTALAKFLSWKEKPQTFLEIERNFPPARNPVFVRICVLLSELENDYIVNQIRRRILLLIIHGLKTKIASDNSSSRLSPLQWPHFVNVAAQSGLLNGEENSVEDKLAKWAKGGSRYHILATELGGIGSVVLLPFDVSPSQWEKKIAMKGSEHDKIVKSLKEHGICEEARKEISTISSGANTTIHDTAEKIYQYLWKELMFDGSLWLHNNPGTDLGLLIAAANTVSKSPSLGETTRESNRINDLPQGSTTTSRTQDYAQQANQPYIDPRIRVTFDGPQIDKVDVTSQTYATFNGQQTNEPYIDPRTHVTFDGPQTNEVDMDSQTYVTFNGQQTNEPYIDPRTCVTFDGPQTNEVDMDSQSYATFNGPQTNEPYIDPRTCVTFDGPQTNEVDMSSQNYVTFDGPQTNEPYINSIGQTEDNPMLCNASSYIRQSSNPFFVSAS